MDSLNLILIAITGIAAGFINVMAGGGSLLTMPIMKFLLGLDGPEVNGSNRIAIGAGAITAVFRFFKKGYADFKLSLTLSACAVPGAVVGALMGTRLRGLWFNRTLALVMIAVLILMSLKKKDASETSTKVTTTRQRLILGHILMIGIGLYGGFIQAGVGFLLMAVLHKVMGLDLVRVNMHKVFIVMVYTIIAIGIYAYHGKVLWIPGLALAVGNSTGAWIGTHYAVKKGEKLIRIVFQLAVVALAIRLLVN
ncbi:sulfite exporter TauE/SafE family protein [Planctomycetota bacterium]